MKGDSGNSQVCFLSNFPPIECGIATFTKDLITNFNKRFNPKVKSKVAALNDSFNICKYDHNVIMQANRNYVEDYIEIAKKINESEKIKIVCVQHEFGIFGGNYGEYLLAFLEVLEKPVVITFHSIIPNPEPLMRKIVRAICKKSSAIIVMAEKGKSILETEYEIPSEKIFIIHHGIPNTPLYERESLKRKLRLEGKTILLTFGLLSKGKGIEYAIRSLPKLVKKYPDLLYIIVGETHPVIRKNEGEKYRNQLIKEIEKLGLKKHVKFYNKYVSLQEIIEYLQASDIYLATNLDENQIVSGTLAYALGCGKAIVATPSVYAKELLSQERGLLAKFKDPESYTELIEKYLSNSEFRKNVERNAYTFSRKMTWPNVASNYLSVFNSVVKVREETIKKYPKIKLNHMRKITDQNGIIQFCIGTIPDKKSGYTLDDNARALITSILHYDLSKSKKSLEMAKIYLDFIERVQKLEGDFSLILDENGVHSYSEDSFGRTIWALGYTLSKTKNSELKEKSIKIFEKAYNKILSLESPRAKAFSILGLFYYHKKFQNQEILEKIKTLADSLVEMYKEVSSENWKWFEEIITYSNSKLPESLFLAYKITGEEKYLDVATETLNFLTSLVFHEGKISLIGHNGWYKRNQERAFFDQQPIDASTMVQTCLIAYQVTGKREYYENAIIAFNWFLGKNPLNQTIYDDTTGGCFDGLGQYSINLNQGAESTLGYLLARLSLEEIKKINNF